MTSSLLAALKASDLDLVLALKIATIYSMTKVPSRTQSGTHISIAQIFVLHGGQIGLWFWRFSIMNSSIQTSNHLVKISLVTQILSFAIVSPFIALRAYARFQLRHPVGIEDGMCRSIMSSIYLLILEVTCYIAWV